MARYRAVVSAPAQQRLARYDAPKLLPTGLRVVAVAHTAVLTGTCASNLASKAKPGSMN